MKVKINQNEVLNFTHHTGKMEGIPSISTNKYLNENCKKLMNSKDSNCICKYCFVDKVTNQYKDVEPCLTQNHNILTSRILEIQEIKALASVLANAQIFRFESFGDLNNVTQLINYNNIAKYYKRTRFALWSKHYSILFQFFKLGFKLSENITLVLSSPLINQELSNILVDRIKTYHKRTITFTVVNVKSDKVNCGGRKCIECRNCYDKKNPHDVIELQK